MIINHEATATRLSVAHDSDSNGVNVWLKCGNQGAMITLNRDEVKGLRQSLAALLGELNKAERAKAQQPLPGMEGAK